MWEQYIEKDNRIIRPLDGSEFVLNGYYISVVDVFPKFSTEDFKKRIQEELSKVEIFNIAIKIIDGHFFFIKKPFEAHVQEVEWTEDEEIENYLQHQDQMVIPYERLMDENHDVIVCFSFKVCQLKNDKTKLTFNALHTFSDGRTVFDLMDLVRKVINGETLEKMDTPLCAFGQKENFRDVDQLFANNSPAQIFGGIEKANLLPPLPEPFNNVCVHYIYDYPPIHQFCKENNVGIQALIMAAYSRAVRKYNNLPKETPLWCIVPSDTRMSSLATEEYKNRQFYCNVGLMYVKIVGQNSFLEDVQHCQKQIKAHQERHEDVIQLLACGQLINKESLQFIPTFALPGAHTHAIISITNFGKVNGNNPLFYSNTLPNFGNYEFLHQVYYTDEKLYISNYKPKDFDKEYIKCIREEMDNALDFSKKEDVKVENIINDLNKKLNIESVGVKY